MRTLRNMDGDPDAEVAAIEREEAVNQSEEIFGGGIDNYVRQYGDPAISHLEFAEFAGAS